MSLCLALLFILIYATIFLNIKYLVSIFLTMFFPIAPGVYILIGAGSLIMLVGFFGCCGAVRESQCLLGSVSAIPQLIWLSYVLLLG